MNEIVANNVANGLVLLTVGLVGAITRLLWNTSHALERICDRQDDHERRIAKLEDAA